ncbi:MAG: hypothetical protein ACUVXI_05775 [bacterium]
MRKVFWAFGIAVLLVSLASGVMAQMPFKVKGGLNYGLGMSDFIVGYETTDAGEIKKTIYYNLGSGIGAEAGVVFSLSKTLDLEAGGSVDYTAVSWSDGVLIDSPVRFDNVSVNSWTLGLHGLVKSKLPLSDMGISLPGVSPYFGIGPAFYFANNGIAADAKVGGDEYRAQGHMETTTGIGLNTAAGVEFPVIPSLLMFVELKFRTVSFWPSKLVIDKFEVDGKDKTGDLPADPKEAADPDENPEGYPAKETPYEKDSEDNPSPNLLGGNVAKLNIGVIYSF